MNIKCKNCQKDNPIGSIFCRLCGAKLDIEDFDKDMKKYLKHKEVSHIFSYFLRIFLVIFFLVAIYGTYLIIEPVKYFKPVPALPKGQEQPVLEMFNKVDIGTPGTYTFTEEQLSYLATRLLAKRGNIITISLPENKYFAFTITKNLINYFYINLDVRVTAVCELVVKKSKTGRNILAADFKYLKLGDLRLPEWYNQLFMEDFTPYATSRKAEGFLRKIDEVKIENGKLEIVLNKL